MHLYLRLNFHALILGVAAAGVIAMASPATAAVVQYNSEAAFDAAASGLTTFGFTSLSGTPPGFDVESNPVTFNGFTFKNDVTPANVADGGSPIIFVIDSAATMNYGKDFLAFQNTDVGMSGSIASAGVTAFGFNFGSYVNIGSLATLTLSTGDSFVITPTDTAQFIGFLSDAPITSVSFAYPGSYSFDIISVSSNLAPAAGGVPEPASWALMILGFGGVGSLIRRRRGLSIA
ncbi:PEPxxWA-CTERM sorting domain-containing protein [Phenylobacterium sp.]|uniref:PEPxxWA-CTERM sorting domain-containing protein n=1 Tax=Phenylobacterium sp. TaxID=1871053 RepID=UPI0025DE5B60|nr:PEPxxWA-CTERM sorting domain-containing protein [Phenylobacterium sp.]